MHPMLTTAVKAARRAGAIINRASLDIGRLAVTDKSLNEYVTEVDHLAEKAIIEILLEAYPKHAILAEESGARGESEYQWVIDPLDGTTNFLHGFPQYAVSIGLMHKGVITQAVVYDPVHNDLYTATRGSGAFLNDHRLRVSRTSQLKGALIGTGFPYKDFTHIDAYLAIFRELLSKTSGLRRPGSAALDLAATAAGRFDGFWEFGLNAWDIAAGTLLIQEAGGLVGDLHGNDNYLSTGNIVAGNPKIFAGLLRVIDAHLTPELRERVDAT